MIAFLLGVILGLLILIGYMKWKKNPPDQLSQTLLVNWLVLQTSGLELGRGQKMQLASIGGSYGPITLSGNSHPVFEYTLFERKIMEFIRVRVEVSRPERIEYIATIWSTTAPERHGEKIEVKEEYKKPFIALSKHLYSYFPLYNRNESTLVKDTTDQVTITVGAKDGPMTDAQQSKEAFRSPV